jgi:glycosyltransferase involved in cell wall biosynthesis
MHIIHIVSSLSSTNYGVWHAAISGSNYLQKKYNVHSELWICRRSVNDTIQPDIPYCYVDSVGMQGQELYRRINSYSRRDTIFITHGSWLRPTHIGYKAKKAGYKWIYTSHGMLEPWSLKIGWIKKKIYFNLIEKRMSLCADAIRAVSAPEQKNLIKLYGKEINLVYNGVKIPGLHEAKKNTDKKVFLFLARLHHKKGILPLVKAWNNGLKDNSLCELLIVGPDEGEAAKIKPYLGKNVQYLGPRFGDEKVELLKKAHFYVLPSFSEGFPSSVVEAMSYGCIPLISDGCNFPEVFQENLGYETGTDEVSIEHTLLKVAVKAFDIDLSRKNQVFVDNHLSEEIIGEHLFNLYKKVLDTPS